MPIADESRAASVTAIRKGRSAKTKATERSAPKSKKRAPVKAKSTKVKSSKATKANRPKQKTPVKKSTLSPKKASTAVRDKSPHKVRRSPAGEGAKPKTPTPPQPPSVGKSDSGKSLVRETPPPVESKGPPERKSPPPVESRPPKAPPRETPPDLPRLDAIPEASAESPGTDTPSSQAAEIQAVAVDTALVEPRPAAHPLAKEENTEVADATEVIAPSALESTPTEELSNENHEADAEPVVGTNEAEEPTLGDTKPSSATDEDATQRAAPNQEETKTPQAATESSPSSAEPSKADQRWSNAESSVPAASLASESSAGSGSLDDHSAPDTTPAAAETPGSSAAKGDDASDDAAGQASPDSEPERQEADDLDPNVPWFVQTYLGEQFGPLIKVELDDWVTQGRLTGDCHVFHEGWEEWREARTVYPELELVKAEDDEIELAIAETDSAERTVSSSEPAWYTVRTGLTMINNSTIVAIVAFLLMTIGFFADRELLSEMYFGVVSEEPIDPEEGGGLVSMVLVSWGVITMFMALVGVLVGAIACMAVPRRTQVHPFAFGAVGAMSLALLMAALLFTAVFLSLGPVAEKLDVGSAVKMLVTVVPWAFFLCAQAAMAAIVVFIGMLADYLGQPKITQQMRWFGIFQGVFLLWVLIDAAIIPNDSDAAFTIALFVFLVALIASLAWLTYLARAARDAIRPH